MARFIACLIFLFIFFEKGVAQQSVKTKDAVEIGGLHQWIGVNGNDDSLPVLLFLHGGPGFSSRAYSKKFIKGLKKEFIVVQWDQRETGITAHWSPFTDSLTLEMFHQDTFEVVQYLRQRFKKRKIFLVGYSWGGILGLHFAREYPDLLHAYISVSGMVHGLESEQLTLERLIKKAGDSKNEEAIKEIAQIEVPFPSWEALYYQRKWTAYFTGDNSTKKSYPAAVFRTWATKWLPVFQEASKENFFETTPEINCPVYFFISDKDFVSNYTVAEKYFNFVKASQKQIVWFDHSAHEIPGQEPKKFTEELIKIGNSLSE